MAKVKKILNDPQRVVDETLDGLVLAAGGSVRRLETAAGLIRTDLAPDRVGLLIGGGSGHEPMYTAFVGPGWADASVAGEVFAAPGPDAILEFTRAIDRGKGVLYVYGNYAGDNMNFDMAAELAAEEGITTRTVRVMDDVAAAPPERMTDRRGIGGAFFQVKIAGAAVELRDDLAGAADLVEHARANLRSMGVAVAAGSLPETGEPTFVLGDDEIEIGMGAHGEPGVSRRKLMQADQLVEEMAQLLLRDLPFGAGDKVAVLLNNLGATTMMELMIVNRRLRSVLDGEGLEVWSTTVGPFLTCQEMAGFSISLLRLDDDLKRCLALPARSLGAVVP